MRLNTAIGDDLSTADRPTNILCGLMQLAAETGIDCNGWFAGTRLQPEEISNPDTRMSYRQAITVIRRALPSLPVEGVGLVLGDRQNLGNFGLLGLAMKTAPDFGESVRVGLAYQRNSGALMDITLAEHDDTCVAAVATAPDEASDLQPFLCEELFSSVLQLVRELVGPDFRPLRLELGYPAPRYAQRYRDLFDCEVRFGQPRHALVIERRWLELPFASYNPATSNQVMTLCRMQMDVQPPCGETTAALESHLRTRLRENPQMAEMAAALHLSERTLRRQLADEGTSFSAVHDRVRTKRAMELLRDPKLSIVAIGGRLGFNDAREFRRAFKRWTGRAPSEARRSGD
ncbi:MULTISPECIES: AraC family transcriptional regulator [Stenotrophomonas]|uniref:HTH araC/xylS-type domain-containing protein n=1 Tax=Stenotrophomonas nitritireducens TaxID=83617 RepID=A0ABR5NKK6_9GAMM|nr:MULTISPECIES: AraC family transcriptional regulator [Stenotrophomonas]KQO02517.1 hypothetical protein ASF01_02045 [Stenotrophomonas sp. Leaf70]KRG57736.1 hypothetical protein ABB22_08645 [Stenotrophomonas nitritireducens]